MSKFACTNSRCTYGCKLEISGRREAPKMCQYTGENTHWIQVESEQFGISEQLTDKIKGFVEKALDETAKKLHDKVIAHPYARPNQPVTDCNQLPKLTAEVFNRPDCPKWAKFAAVSSFGWMTFYENKPQVGDGGFNKKVKGKWKNICRYEYDFSDWENSLIERPIVKDELVIRFKKLHPDAKAPYQATTGSGSFEIVFQIERD